MKQYYRPYWTWEDWINGMWNKSNDEEALLEKAIKFTSDHVIYGNAMREVINEWPNTMLNSLTNKSINRRAFLGHCAACYKINCPEYITRRAWKLLTEDQRVSADLEAEKTIKQWEQKQLKELIIMFQSGKKDAIQMGYQTSLQLK